MTVGEAWSKWHGPTIAEEHIVHAIVVVIVVLAGSVLRALHDLDNNTISIVYGTSIGYAAGRSGTRTPRVPTRDDA